MSAEERIKGDHSERMRCASSVPPRNVDSQERHSATSRDGSRAGVRVPARRDNEAVVAGRDDNNSSIAAEDSLRRRTVEKQAGGGRGERHVGVEDEKSRPKRRFKVLGNMFEVSSQHTGFQTPTTYSSKRMMICTDSSSSSVVVF